MKAELHESLDRHDWELQDVTVTQLVLDPGALRIVAWHADGSAEFRLGSPFSYTEADGLAREIDPEQAEQVSPLLALVSRPLTRITVERSGQLALAFGDGSLLRIEPHAHSRPGRRVVRVHSRVSRTCAVPVEDPLGVNGPSDR